MPFIEARGSFGDWKDRGLLEADGATRLLKPEIEDMREDGPFDWYTMLDSIWFDRSPRVHPL